MRYPLRLFLDTNVLVDLLEPRFEFLDAIQRVFSMAFYGDAELWASANCMTDLFFIINKNSHDREDDLQTRMLKLVTIRDASRLHIYGPQQRDVLQALRYHWKDFEDCLVSVCAENVKADFIVTRDRRGFDQSVIPSLSPNELLEKVEKEDGIVYENITW